MDKIIKFLGLLMVVFFIVMLFSSSSGYYEYEINKKSNLTQEAIIKFEQDVKDGKDIDVEEYLVKKENDYTNNFTKTGLSISNKIERMFAGGIKFIFNTINNFVEE